MFVVLCVLCVDHWLLFVCYLLVLFDLCCVWLLELCVAFVECALFVICCLLCVVCHLLFAKCNVLVVD